jgi:hypothetical protein
MKRLILLLRRKIRRMNSMGYWSKHPMGGDFPRDERLKIVEKACGSCKIYDELFSSDIKNDTYHLDEVIKEGLTEKFIDKATRFRYSEGHKFVLPFVIAEYEIRIKDKKISDKVKAMIGDGGSSIRGYNINDPDSPGTHAKRLYDLWDDLMEGKVEFSEIYKDPGLLETIAQKKSDPNHKGLINVD